MLYIPFRTIKDVAMECENFSDAYYLYLQSGASHPSLENDIQRYLEKAPDDDIPESSFLVSELMKKNYYKYLYLKYIFFCIIQT